ncbi:MAG: universal stress protein [Desulfobacterium sp.]|jgi:nucleotide-binding universal stress UspA family protein|nr:universal stress protein [Desulfobacterium sp.]
MILPEVKIENILYATDLSDSARHAFAYAVSLAEHYGAKITILHVIPELHDSLEKNLLGYVSKDVWDEIKVRNLQETRHSLIGKKRDNVMIHEVLARFSDEVKRESTAEKVFADEIVIDRGNPVRQILKQSEERDCDIIVMGTHGQSTLADVVVGSITRRVLRRSKKPVLVVRLPENKR